MADAVDLYARLATAAPAGPGGGEFPGTALTASVESYDEDRAGLLLSGLDW